MRKQIIPFVGLALLLWLVAGILWYNLYYSNARYLHNTEVNTSQFALLDLGILSNDISWLFATHPKARLSEKTIDHQSPKVIKTSLKQAEPDDRVQVPALNLYFPNKVYKLKETDDILAYINQLKDFIDDHPDAKIILTGFTDDQGDYETNMTISRRRARSVRNFLVQNGIKKNNTEFTYHGPQAPIASNETEEGRKINRRVEIRIEY